MHHFDGVFIPCFTNIVGTLLYLRMGYLAGQAGICKSVGGKGRTHFVEITNKEFLLLFSGRNRNCSILNICCRNYSPFLKCNLFEWKTIKGGNLLHHFKVIFIYFCCWGYKCLTIWRSLGPQIGGVIGVIFSLANVGMAALYIVGIAEFISDLLTENGYSHFTISKQDDIRVFSLSLIWLNFRIHSAFVFVLVVCGILMLITFAGPDIENSITLIFFSTYVLSYVNWLLGTMLPVSEEKFIRGVTGYSCESSFL